MIPVRLCNRNYCELEKVWNRQRANVHLGHLWQLLDITPGAPFSLLVIDAGAAGLTAAHLLDELGIDFQVLEATVEYGGRLGFRRLRHRPRSGEDSHLG